MFRLTSSALALIAMTAPAFADVTPEQVWQSWLDYYKSVGYTVSEGSREMAGNTLTLRDVQISGGADDSKMVLSVPQVVLSGTDGGKVNTSFADELKLDLTGTTPADESEAENGAEGETEADTFAVPMVIKMPGNAIVTSGAPEDMTHEFSYPSISLVTTTMTTNGTEAPLPMNFGLTNSTGKLHIVSGASAKYDYDMTSETMSFDGDIPDDQGGKVKFAGKLDALHSKGSMTAPGDLANLEEDMEAALKAGLVIDGTFTTGALDASFDFAGVDEDGQPSSGAGKYASKGFDAGFKLSQDGMSYKLGSDAINFELTSPQIPFPVSYGIESGSMDMQMPVSQRDEAQPFRFAYALKGVTMAEDIWKMFDPQASLPRDPASLELDLSGLMKVTANLFAMPVPADDTDAATAEGVAPDTPADDEQADAEAGEMGNEAAAEPLGFEPVEVTINKLALNLLGASADATGQLKAVEGGSFDAPIGQIHAEYKGVNALLDTLGSIGLIPEDQMMGVRMMLAMFAKPVEGSPDTMTTDLEFKDGGAVFANGQQIK